MNENLSPQARKDIDYTIHPYTNLAAHQDRGPLIIDRGEGIYVWDDQGKRYIEGLAGLWCTSLGFSEQRLVDAASAQLSKLPYSHTFAHRSTQPVIDLSEKLIAIAPGGMAKAFLANSGSEAVDTAMKFAWYYNNGLGRREKKKIIARRRAYHGVTIASGSLTNLAVVHNDFDLPIERILHTDSPCYYRDARPDESEQDFSTRLAKALEQLILEEDPDTVAAFIAEPIMGAGGVIVPPAGYFEKVQAILHKYDILFIADEVICGFGRTGNMWGSQTFGLQPDMVTCAKQLSSAYSPISAVMISEGIYEVFVGQSRQHGAFGMGYTYGGHPVAAAVALETLRIYEEDRILDKVRALSPVFQSRLDRLEEHPLVGNARGCGLIGGIELVADKDSRSLHPAEKKAAVTVSDHALQQGLIVRAIAGDIVAVCPPLIIQEAEINELFDRLERALDSSIPMLA